jgi:predicted GNAT family N-acyltransferase
MPAEPSSSIAIQPVKGEGELMQALAIREVVFIEEQSVPEDIERDDEDAQAYHLLAIDKGHAIGTGRLVALKAPPEGETGSWGRVGRMAVLQAYRRSGVGTRLLGAFEDEARKRGMAGIMLHAQLSAMDFYKRHGYQPHGAVFEEAGMPHLEMKRRL